MPRFFLTGPILAVSIDVTTDGRLRAIAYDCGCSWTAAVPDERPTGPIQGTSESCPGHSGYPRPIP